MHYFSKYCFSSHFFPQMESPFVITFFFFHLLNIDFVLFVTMRSGYDAGKEKS